MDVLQKVKQWLLTYPGWEDAQLYVDYLEAAPSNSGLYPQGLEERSRRVDVLGNVKVSCRYRFALHRMTAGQLNGEENARWLLDFQQWVQQQSIAGLTPQFGDVAAYEQIRAEKGQLREASQVGTGTYQVILIADFIKLYEVNE